MLKGNNFFYKIVKSFQCSSSSFRMVGSTKVVECFMFLEIVLVHSHFRLFYYLQIALNKLHFESLSDGSKYSI
jgi:hypothetical protein